MVRPGCKLKLILVSSHEATGSIITKPWIGCKSIPLLSPPPPFTPLALYQVSLTNFCYPFILLGGDRHCRSKVFCTRTQHIDWNHLTNHKTTMSPQEETVYADSFLIRNKFYYIKEKLSYLIFK